MPQYLPLLVEKHLRPLDTETQDDLSHSIGLELFNSCYRPTETCLKVVIFLVTTERAAAKTQLVKSTVGLLLEFFIVFRVICWRTTTVDDRRMKTKLSYDPHRTGVVVVLWRYGCLILSLYSYTLCVSFIVWLLSTVVHVVIKSGTIFQFHTLPEITTCVLFLSIELKI